MGCLAGSGMVCFQGGYSQEHIEGTGRTSAVSQMVTLQQS